MHVSQDTGGFTAQPLLTVMQKHDVNRCCTFSLHRFIHRGNRIPYLDLNFLSHLGIIGLRTAQALHCLVLIPAHHLAATPTAST